MACAKILTAALFSFAATGTFAKGHDQSQGAALGNGQGKSGNTRGKSGQANASDTEE